jgi:hypothetical protein
MIGIVRDTWRAVLVVGVVVLLRDVLAERPAAPAAPVVAPAWQPAAVQWSPPPVATGAWQPMPQAAPPVETKGPIRRVAREIIDLSEAVLGVVR